MYLSKKLALAVSSTVLSTSLFAADTYLEEVVITSSRIEMPLRQVGTSVSVLTAKDIELLGFNSLMETLRSQTAIGATNSGGAGKQSTLRVRGEEGFRTLIRVDGVEISDPTGTQVTAQVQHLLSADVDRVEILRGPQGMMYGADAGGVINITTKTPKSGLEGGVSLEGGRYGTRQASANIAAGSDKGAVYLGVTDYETDGFNTSVLDSVDPDADGYENTTVHLKARLNVTDAFELSAVVRDVEGTSEFDQCGFQRSNDCEGQYDQRTTRLSADYKQKNLNHSFAVSRTDIDRQTSLEGANNFLTLGTLDRIEYVGSADLSDNTSLVYGLDWKEEDIQASSGSLMDRSQKGFFIEAQSSIENSIFFTAGIRHDDNDNFGEHTSYRATAAWVLDLADGSTLKYKAALGTGFRAPSLSEIAYNFGPYAFGPAASLSLTEELSKGFDTGFEYRTVGGLKAELVYFNQTVEDEVYFDLVNFYGYLQAEGKARSEGAELSLNVPITDAVSFYGNYTYNDTEKPTGAARARRPRHLANLGMNLHFLDDKLSLAASVRLAKDAKNEVYGVGYVPLDDYEVVELSANFQLTPSAEIFARIENAGNQRYQELTNFNVSGSALYAGLRMNF